ncbi:hypothetical protein AYWB_391 [Aster yellows witches'-broom phytoplasma AYWB]|uniref:Uncharacterized protein n=1 Tax=Aster yellows witches'-broom phytoplasma (strain AYWB) TaxID=322098 RepID=Q2NJ85_AYWBP|nr:hypothetical protein [Aster yellows witches'-broom phytoplasma]ABC65508.1 hypothetical protein AYWB_391 [Aster yellows witches'-broom phytoplasma AYWB]
MDILTKPTPKAKTPPPNLVEVYDLDAIKATEESKLKKRVNRICNKTFSRRKNPKRN